jgi:hypothetical protein
MGAARSNTSRRQPTSTFPRGYRLSNGGVVPLRRSGISTDGRIRAVASRACQAGGQSCGSSTTGSSGVSTT